MNKKKTRFYTFYQNNSWGSITISDNLAKFVIIQVINHDHANKIAEKIGIYFDGHNDCGCCGHRWSRVHDFDGYDKPMIYGEDAKLFKFNFWESGIIHYHDGKKKKLKKKK